MTTTVCIYNEQIIISLEPLMKKPLIQCFIVGNLIHGIIPHHLRVANVLNDLKCTDEVIKTYCTLNSNNNIYKCQGLVNQE